MFGFVVLTELLLTHLSSLSTKCYRCWKTYFELYLCSVHISAEEISSTISNINNSIPPKNNESMSTEYDLDKQRYVNNRAVKLLVTLVTQMT